LGTRNNYFGPKLYTNPSEQPINTNQDSYVWNENSEATKKLLERNKEIENLICDVMSDYKAFKDKAIDQISKQNKINQELTKRINNYKYKQNHFNRRLSNCIVTVQTEFSDELEKLKEQLEKLNNNKSPIIGVLKTMESNYPINNIIVNGVSLHVSNFISITHNDVAYFKSNEKLKIIDGQRIDGIEL
jgi:seryl-tRNA synthetase